MYIHYLQLELSGKLAGNFDLIAIAPAASQHTTIVYQKTGQTHPAFFDAGSDFRTTLSSFSGSPQFDPSHNIFPDLPEDLQALVEFSVGSVHLTAYMLLALDVEVEGGNSFKAQAGAFADAGTRVALFVFEKIRDEEIKFFGPNIVTGTCTSGYVHNPSVCALVLQEAGVTEVDNTMYCVPPYSSSHSGVCVGGKYLVINIFEPPSMKSGLNGPSLTAGNSENLQVSVSAFPIAKVSAYNGLFSLYFAPEIKAVFQAESASTGKCSGKMQIMVCAARWRVQRSFTSNDYTTTFMHTDILAHCCRLQPASMHKHILPK